MGQQTERRSVDGVAADQRHAATDALENPHAFLIRIRDKATRKRALMALGGVRVPYCAFPDYQMLVAREHVEVLQREKIPFETLS